jgi:hypothetical protein
MSVVSSLRRWRHRWCEQRALSGPGGSKRITAVRKYRPKVELLEDRQAIGSFFNGFGLSLAHTLPQLLLGSIGLKGAPVFADRTTTHDVAQAILSNDMVESPFTLDAATRSELSSGTATAPSAARSSGLNVSSSQPAFADAPVSSSGGGIAASGNHYVAQPGSIVSATERTPTAPAGVGASQSASSGDTLFHMVSAAASSVGSGNAPLTSPHWQPIPLWGGGGGGGGGGGWVNWRAIKPMHGPPPPPPGHGPQAWIHRPRIVPLSSPFNNGIGTPVDASHNFNGPMNDESEEDIAINPTNPNNIFAFSNDNNAVNGILAMTSFDGGNTWNARDIATGFDFPGACCDPSVAFDNFGNLFASYIDQNSNGAELLLSTDGGNTFSHLASFTDVFDQPKLAAGAGTIWIVWTSNTTGTMEGSSAAVNGLGSIASFGAVKGVPGTNTALNFGRIAVGPGGQALQSFQTDPSSSISVFAPDNLQVSFNPGLGGSWSAPIIVGSNNVGFRASAPPLTPDRGAAMFSSVAYDNSNGQFRGRAYLVYMDLPTVNSQQYDIFLRHSDDNGSTWSAPVRVTDDSTGRAKTQPRVAVDSTNGDVAISWLDSRNDNGDHGPGDLDGKPGDEVEEFITFSYDGGNTFEPNLQVATSASSAILDPNSGNDYGDYTGLAFYNTIARPAWCDNSTTLSGNPGAPNHFDIASAFVYSVLNPGEDGYEPNETTDTATNMGTLVSSMEIANQTINKHANGLYDYDNFKFTMGGSGTFTATETEDAGRGGLELHLFKLQGNTLVDVGDFTSRTPLVKTLSVSVNKGDIIYVEAKGRNYAPGRMGTGAYHLDLSLA